MVARREAPWRFDPGSLTGWERARRKGRPGPNHQSPGPPSSTPRPSPAGLQQGLARRPRPLRREFMWHCIFMLRHLGILVLDETRAPGGPTRSRSNDHCIANPILFVLNSKISHPVIVVRTRVRPSRACPASSEVATHRLPPSTLPPGPSTSPTCCAANWPATPRRRRAPPAARSSPR